MEGIHRINTIDVTTAYLTLATFLALLIFYNLFRGRKIFRLEGSLPLCYMALLFLAGRTIFLSTEGAVFGGRFFPEIVLGVLTLAVLLIAAIVCDRFLLGDLPKENAVSTVGGFHFRDSGLRLITQTGYFALAGGLCFLLLARLGGMVLNATGIINGALYMATVRPTVSLFRRVFRSALEEKRELLLVLVLMTVSTMALFAMSLFPGNVEILQLIMKSADILLLLGVFLFFHSYNLRIGLHYRKESDSSREEIKKAKEELARLSRIASDVYEDNSDLIKRQKEQALTLTKRVENLEKILQIGITIQKRNKPGDLLQMIVELVRENLGFNTVVLRLFNERTQSFETKAQVGLSEEAVETVLCNHIPLMEYKKMLKTKNRISNSYFLRNNSHIQGEVSDKRESILVDKAWGDIDLFIVPLKEEDNHTIGYLSVEDPENAKGSVADVIENLEIIASLAAISIRNTNIFCELESKNEKLKTYTDKLASLNKMKANFVATISHEFRTPLTSIRAYCETLLRNADDVDRKILKEFLLVIEEESNRLMALIEDILDFSQMESGAIKFERMPCNLNETITVVSKELEKNFKQKNITLHQDLPQTDVIIRAERELIKQLLINLLHNASKFTPEGGNVRVSLKDETVSARIVVTDDGIGIPEDQIGKIFDRFHQADGTDTRKHGGSGLGLAICRNVVEWHDGRIWVENLPRKGTMFTIVLPKKQVMVRSRAINLGETPVQKFEIERYLELLVEIVAEFVGAKRVSIMLFDRQEEDLRIECSIGLDEEVVEHAKLKIGEGIAGKIFQEGVSYLVEDIDEDSRIDRKSNNFLYDSKSFISVPIKINGRTIGVVNATNHICKEKFDKEDCKLLELITGRISVALEKLDRFVHHSVDFKSVRDTFKAILDANRYIDVHGAGDLIELIMRTTQKLGLDREKQARLRYVLNVYDLGLSKVGYQIIKKPVELSSDDRLAVEQHAEYGNNMLEAIEADMDIRNIVLYHHENFDGSGYPGKLTGDAIPLEARILRVADSLRALMSHRPYQKKYTLDEAIEVLKHRSGTFFDPKVVRALLETIEENPHLLNEGSNKRQEEAKELPV